MRRIISMRTTKGHFFLIGIITILFICARIFVNVYFQNAMKRNIISTSLIFEVDDVSYSEDGTAFLTVNVGNNYNDLKKKTIKVDLTEESRQLSEVDCISDIYAGRIQVNVDISTLKSMGLIEGRTMLPESVLNWDWLLTNNALDQYMTIIQIQSF